MSMHSYPKLPATSTDLETLIGLSMGFREAENFHSAQSHNTIPAQARHEMTENLITIADHLDTLVALQITWTPLSLLWWSQGRMRGSFEPAWLKRLAFSWLMN